MFIENFDVMLIFKHGGNTSVVICRVSAGGNVSPVSPVDITPMFSRKFCDGSRVNTVFTFRRSSNEQS